jgi:hypothetical protein
MTSSFDVEGDLAKQLRGDLRKDYDRRRGVACTEEQTSSKIIAIMYLDVLVKPNFLNLTRGGRSEMESLFETILM